MDRRGFLGSAVAVLGAVGLSGPARPACTHPERSRVRYHRDASGTRVVCEDICQACGARVHLFANHAVEDWRQMKRELGLQ